MSARRVPAGGMDALSRKWASCVGLIAYLRSAGYAVCSMWEKLSTLVLYQNLNKTGGPLYFRIYSSILVTYSSDFLISDPN